MAITARFGLNWDDRFTKCNWQIWQSPTGCDLFKKMYRKWHPTYWKLGWSHHIDKIQTRGEWVKMILEVRSHSLQLWLLPPSSLHCYTIRCQPISHVPSSRILPWATLDLAQPLVWIGLRVPCSISFLGQSEVRKAQDTGRQFWWYIYSFFRTKMKKPKFCHQNDPNCEQCNKIVDNPSPGSSTKMPKLPVVSRNPYLGAPGPPVAFQLTTHFAHVASRLLAAGAGGWWKDFCRVMRS